MKLEQQFPEYYRVKRGQTLAEISRMFLIPPRVLAVENNLTAEPQAGSILHIPKGEGNLYVVRGGESKALLCGSAENFERKNRTRLLYPTQVVWL